MEDAGHTCVSGTSATTPPALPSTAPRGNAGGERSPQFSLGNVCTFREAEGLMHARRRRHLDAVVTARS